MIGVGRKLYVAGGLGSSRDATGTLQSLCQSAFHVCDSEHNQWFPLQPMLRSCRNMALVHHGGFIYAIGGRDNSSNPIANFQRYSIVQQCWVDLTPMPLECQKISAVVFKNMILVSGNQAQLYQRINRTSVRYIQVLMIYHPTEDKWIIVENERHGSRFVPILHIHKDQCYRVLCRYIEENNLTEKVYVNKLDFSSHDSSEEGVMTTTSKSNALVQDEAVNGFFGTPTAEKVTEDGEFSVTIGEEIKQDHIPDGSDAFRIDDEVFVIINGFVYTTDMKIKPAQTYNVDVSLVRGRLEGYRDDDSYSTDYFVRNATFFRFDKEKLREDCHDQSILNETESAV